MENSQIKNYFPGGNTFKGFHSFYRYLPYKCDNVFIIKGGPGTGKSTTMKSIAKEGLKRGLMIEYHWCSSDNNSIDGVVIPSKKTAIFDGTDPHLNDPEYPGALDNILNFGQCWDKSILKKNKQKIIKLNQKISDKFNSLYHFLEIAHILRKEEENYYQKAINDKKLVNIEEQLINDIIPVPNHNNSDNHSQRRLFGSAITPEGQISYLDSLSTHLQNKYILKGKPEIEKSKIIKKIGNKLYKYGYNVLFLHCGFNPNHIDGIIVPELSTGLIDGTNPHKIMNTENNTKKINLLDSLNSQILSDYYPQIKEMQKLFKKFINKGINNLKKAKILHDKLEEIYIDAMNFKKVDKKKNSLIKEIFN